MLTYLLYKTLRFKQKTIFLKDQPLTVFLADSFWKQGLGLMHRTNLGDSDGMLFIFSKTGKHDIWMLNMNFSLDILWLDSTGKIIQIIENAKPCVSRVQCKAYSSPNNAKYVFELGSGEIKKYNISLNDCLTI